MGHKHWCDFAGHEWECNGLALRLFRNEPTPCVCLQHGVSMEDGDHSACSVELVACPEHHDDQMRAMGYDPALGWPEEPESNDESSTFRDADGNRTVGFCLWCGCDFYSMADHEAHVADEMAACPVFQQLKNEQHMPPILEAMLDAAEPTDPEKQ